MPNFKKENKQNNLTLDLAIQGDLDAFSVLYKENVQKIYNYIYYRTGNSHDAEDLTARVFQRALKSISRYKNKGVPFSAWLYRIAHNLVANWHRDNKRKREISIDDSPYAFSDSVHLETTLIKGQEVAELMVFVRKLAPDRQMVLILKYVDDLTNSEIGEILGKSEGAIKSLYHRTLLQLRQEMKKKSQKE
jgi:RNA polymerase sigma-70 factor (ECF subfamily)